MQTGIIIACVLTYTMAAVLVGRKAYKNGLNIAVKEGEVMSWKITTALAGAVFPLTLLVAATYIALYRRKKRKEKKMRIQQQ